MKLIQTLLLLGGHVKNLDEVKGSNFIYYISNLLELASLEAL